MPKLVEYSMKNKRIGIKKLNTINISGSIRKADRHGRITKLKREFWGQGWIFKNWNAFEKHRDSPCYVPELSDTVYTGNDFMVLCDRQEEIAARLFCEVDWQSPAALMHEWDNGRTLEFVCDMNDLAYLIEQLELIKKKLR